MILNPLPFIFAVFLAAFPAFLGVFACDKLVNKSEDWRHMIWPESLMFALAFAFSFVSKPIEVALLSTVAIPTSLVGFLIIGYGLWVNKNEAEYCGKDNLYFYALLSLLAGLILLAVRLFFAASF